MKRHLYPRLDFDKLTAKQLTEAASVIASHHSDMFIDRDMMFEESGVDTYGAVGSVVEHLRHLAKVRQAEVNAAATRADTKDITTDQAV